MDVINSYDYNKMLDSVYEILKESIQKACDGLKITYSESDFEEIQKIWDESLEEVDIDNMISELKTDFESSYDDMINELDTTINENFNDSDSSFELIYSIALTGKEGSYIGEQKLLLENKDIE